MQLYFADNQMNITGMASSGIGDVVIQDPLLVKSVEHGGSTLECSLYGDVDVVPNGYVIYNGKSGYDLFSVIEVADTHPEGKVYFYAEDAGVDFINSVVGPYAASTAHPIAYYINKFKEDSGYEIGINEAEDLERKIKWEGEATTLERLLSVATQFDCELSFSCDIEGLKVTHRYINIHRRRGADTGLILRLGHEVSSIKRTRYAGEIYTAIQVSGGIPEGQENPITLDGYTYDDGDIFLQGTTLYSRSAREKHTRFDSSDIKALYSYDTTSQSELCNRGVSFLRAHEDIAESYEVEFFDFPQTLNAGDTVTIVGDGISITARIQTIKEDQNGITGTISNNSTSSRVSASVEAVPYGSDIHTEDITYYVTRSAGGSTGKWAKVMPATVIDYTDGVREVYVNLHEDSISSSGVGSYWYRSIVRFDFEGVFSKVLNVTPNWVDYGRTAVINRSGTWSNDHNFELQILAPDSFSYASVDIPVCIRGMR